MKKNSLLRISNVLNLTRQEFTIIEKHIFILTLLKLKEQQGFDVDFDIENDKVNIDLTIDASEIKENNRERIKEALDKITSRKIHFDNSTSDKEYFGYIIPFIYARYESINGVKSEINLMLHSKSKKLFLSLADGYTTMDLKAILSLKSTHSIRMYELMSMYKNQASWTIEISKLKELLGLGYDVYKNFSDFKRYILEYSQKELWEHCNLHFEWEIAEKKGKKITALTFHIRERNKQERIELNEEIEATKDYLKSLSPADISQKANWVIKKYKLNENQQKYILNNTEVFNEFVKVDLIIENMTSKGNPPRNRTSYLAKSLGLDKVKFPKNKKE